MKQPAGEILADVIAAYGGLAWDAESLKTSLEEISERRLGPKKLGKAQAPGARRGDRTKRRSAAVRGAGAARPRPDPPPAGGSSNPTRRMTSTRAQVAAEIATTPIDDESPARRAGRGGRRARRIGAGTMLLVLGYYLVTLFQVWSVSRADQARPVDAIVVLGAAQYDGRPSPQLAARLDHALSLYEQGLAPLVVVTGGKQAGDRFTEAAASACLPGRARCPCERDS